ncbi:Thioredoxin [Halobacillus karajensis]|uniref:thioredoxin family protein n=1 Tax=Halobacillus karajensis TaxID=195088 RepID=UPI0008A7E47F|nr:thioredoxin family protein [Halobacillus karajensis]SEI10622.1 Thioredoxin [Halobacillus karajensis]
MNLGEWYAKGMTTQTYVDQMQTHKKDFIYIYENFSVPVEDQPLFDKIQQQKIRALILTEDWCGDAMLNIPIFLRMAESGHIPVHFLRRDENLELMDQYLTNGVSRSIPKIIFIDATGHEISHWGPRAPELQKFIDQSIAGLPEEKAPDYQEKKREMLTFVTKAYRDNRDFWSYVYNDIKKQWL